jgi:hypothetical protein
MLDQLIDDVYDEDSAVVAEEYLVVDELVGVDQDH